MPPASAAECPELAELERVPPSPAVRAHAATCRSCQLILDMFDRSGSASDTECQRFEPLLAARADGSLTPAGTNLLDRHLASCSTCRAAESMSPIEDAQGDHEALPEVGPEDYEIGGEIGRGGMGRVLAGRDLRIGRPVAIKELRGKSPHLAARFEREARVTARLQHPGIVPIYEIGRWVTDGTPFYTMRMVDGRMLRVAIDRATSHAQRLAMLPNVIAACEAVAFAHSQRVIHRDLTPSNILVGAYGETVVIDWGLAKDLSPGVGEENDADDPYRTTPEGSALTGVGTVVGTAAYMPPEQARADSVDERADVYALGAILYHLLAGKPPYPSGPDALDAVKSGPPPSIDEVAPRTPRDLVSIVSKAMARDQRDRYPSARELADELKRFQTGRLVEAHVYTRGELMRRFVRRHRAPVIVTAAAALLLAGGGTVAVRGILKSSAEARATVRELVVEKGREELLAGNPIRALAYLHSVHRLDAREPVLQFLLGNALSNVASSAHVFDCGGDARWVEFSPDGKSVAAACHDRGAIFDLESGKTIPLRAVNGFDWVKYTHDGSHFITSGADGIARLWNAKTGAFVRQFPHGAPIQFATFTEKGDRLLTTGDDGAAKVWDVASGAVVVWVNVGDERLFGTISAKGDLFFTMTLKGNGKGWDAMTGEELGTAKHGGFVVGAELSRDSKYAVTCGYDGLTKVWDLQNGPALVHTLGGHTDVVWKCVFSPNNTLIATAGQDGTAKVWDLATGAMITSVTHGAYVWSAGFAPDNRRFYTLGANGRINVWDAASGARLASWDTAHGKNAAFSPTTTQLAVVRGDGRVQIWDDPGLRIASYVARDVKLLATTSDGLRVITQDAKLDVTVSDTVTGTPITGAAMKQPVAVSREERIAARTRGGVVIVDGRTGAVANKVELPCEPTWLDLAGDRLAVICASGISVWDVASGRSVGSLGGVTRARLATNGRYAVVLTDNRMPRIWDIAANTQRPLGVGGDVMPVGFAHGDTRVAFATLEPLPKAHRIKLFDVQSGEQLLDEADTNLESGFDPSGQWITTISTTGVTVWSTLDGREHTTFATDHSEQQYSLMQVQASPDGHLVAAIGMAGAAALVMDANTGRELARWPIVHDRPALRTDLSGFTAPSAMVAWTAKGDAVVTRSLEAAVWNARYAASQFDPAQIASLMRKYVPWVVVEGDLQLVRDGQLAGRITRNGKPVGGAQVHLEIRIVPAGASAIDYESMKTQSAFRDVRCDDIGEFKIESLIPGQYNLTVEGDPQPHIVTVGVENDPVTLELTR